MSIAIQQQLLHIKMAARVDAMIHVPHGTEGIAQNFITLLRTVHNLKLTNWEFSGGPAGTSCWAGCQCRGPRFNLVFLVWEDPTHQRATKPMHP